MNQFVDRSLSRLRALFGARVERLNWLADTSVKGLRQSYGLMVNYLYEPEAIEGQVEAYVATGKIHASASVRRQGRTLET